MSALALPELPFDHSKLHAVRLEISSEVDHSAWLAARRGGLGASDIPAALGLDSFKSALQLYMEKRGEIEADLPPDEEYDEIPPHIFGQKFEKRTIEVYGEWYRRKVICNSNIYRSTRYPWLGCTPDGFDLEDPSWVKSLQVKWTTRDGWGDEVPDYVYAQVQGELAGTSLTRAVVIAITPGFGGFRFRTYILDEDLEFQADMVAKCEDFWRRVQEGDPPAPDGSKSANRMLKLRYPHVVPEKSFSLDLEHEELTRELDALTAKIKRYEARQEELRQRIRSFIGDAESVVMPDGSGWTCKSQSRRAYVKEVKAAEFRVLRRFGVPKAKKKKGNK